MTPATDPYRTLGLDPGATPAEIKRAYRRLAKAYHPDSAGERALPRFLAIQAAYERLTAGQVGGAASGGRQGPSRRGSGPGPTPPPAGHPWSADAERARASREAYRQRNTRPGAGRAAGAEGSPGPSRKAGTSGGPGPDGSSRGAPGGAPGGVGQRPAGAGRGSGRRGRPKASIGSTSYDGTENEPYEPGWSGATWYGAASGTYWTINPKEYADPRKHGPEYLARARRNLRADTDLGESGSPSQAEGDPSHGPGSDPDAPAASAGSAVPPRRGPAESEAPASGGPALGERGVPVARAQPRRPAATGKAPVPTAPARLRLLEPSRVVGSWRGRIVLAALAWLPIGLAIFGLHGQVTGCAQFMASCTDPVAWSVWIPQAIAFLLLLTSPRLAWIAASGTVILLCLTTPLAAILTAGSGGRPPSPATTQLLLATMAAGWLGGVGIALSGRIPLPPWRTARVR